MSPTFFLILTGGLAFVMVIGGAANLVLKRNVAVKERVGLFTDGSGQPLAEGQLVEAKPEHRASPLGDRLNKALAGRDSSNKISVRLAQADLKLTVGEYYALNLICVVAAVAVGWLIFGQILLVVLSGVVGYFGPGWYLGFRKNRRVRAFNNQLSDTLNLWVNALRSGYSVLQAMEAIARELPPPVSVEFARVVQEVRLGLTVETAMANLLRRIDSDDMDLVVTAVNVQREVGGNLAEILDVISHTIRERVRIKGEIRVMTAMGRYSGYIITLLPVILTLLLFVINRAYVIQLFSETCGWIMVGVGVTMIAAGFFAIQKIVDVEV